MRSKLVVCWMEYHHEGRVVSRVWLLIISKWINAIIPHLKYVNMVKRRTNISCPVYSHRLHEWLVSLSEKLQAWWLSRWEFNNVLFSELKLFLNLKIDYKNAIDWFASSGMKSQSFQNSVHGNQKNAFRSNILISRMASLFDPDYCLKVLGVNIDGRLQLLPGIWPYLAYTVYTD